MTRITRRSVLATAGASFVAGPAAARNPLVRVGGGAGSNPLVGGNPFITSVPSPGSTTSGPHGTTTYGFQFTPAVDITITALGREAQAGNSQSHTITIYNTTFGHPTVPGGSAVVNMSGSTPGQFVYAPLSGPPYVVLWAGITYDILATEISGGDNFLSNDTVVATTADGVLNDAVYFDTGLGFITTTGSGTNKPYGPVNFKYIVGAPGGVSRPGSAFAASSLLDSVWIPLSGNSPIVTGSAYSLFATLVHGGGTPGGTSFTYQWILDGTTPISPVITNTNTGFPYTWDSTGTADGTHSITVRMLDCDTTSIFHLNIQGKAIIVANHGFNNGTQTFPVAAANQNRSFPSTPDYVTYTSGNPNPVRDTYPAATYAFIPGAANVSSPYHSNPALLRDHTLWYGECLPGPRTGEYDARPEMATTPSGGVYPAWFDSLASNLVSSSYISIVFQNSMDGTRLNGWVSPFSTYIEDPAGGGKWWFVEINGRVGFIDNTGAVTTVVGRTRNRSLLTYDPGFPGLLESDIDTKITNVGTFPVGVDNLGGANDLCFDPTDSNILYVACQVDNWIARITLSTQTVTVYAGSPGAPDGYTGDGGPALSATFAAPTSIIMDGSRTMYVCDSNNQAIRKIVAGGSPSVAGNITTLCGGTVGPTPPTIGQMTGGTAYPVGTGSVTWNSGTSTGVVVMQNATTIQLGWTLSLSGATASGGDPNTSFLFTPRYVVTAFTDSQHFTISFEATNSGKPSLASGAFGGSPVFTTIASDIYCSPTSVSFAAGCVPFPNVIRFSSNGDIIVADTVANAVRQIHLGSSTITRVNCFDNFLSDGSNGGAEQWIWIAVDTAGMIGPVDDILVFKVQNAINGAHDQWRMALGTFLSGAYSDKFFGDGFSLETYGPVDMIEGGPGHYPWAIEISKHEGRMIGTGLASFNPILMRIIQSGDPAVGVSGPNYNGTVWDAGSVIYVFGTAQGGPNNQGTYPAGVAGGFPANVRPSFVALRGSGSGWMTNLPGADTFEDFMATYPTDGALAAYIQSGMGGAVPRPEIVGNDMRNLIYNMRRGTLQGSLGPTPYQPGPDQATVGTPIILTVSAVRNNATQITVSWTTDRPTLGMVAAGAPGNYALNDALGRYTLFSALEASFGTTHSMAVQVLTGVSPVHYVVVCEDQNGSFAHTTDQTVA